MQSQEIGRQRRRELGGKVDRCCCTRLVTVLDAVCWFPLGRSAHCWDIAIPAAQGPIRTPRKCRARSQDTKIACVSLLVSAVTGFLSGALGSILVYRVLVRPRGLAPSVTGELATAVADFERQLDGLEFNPEAEGVTADMRAQYARARAACSDAVNAMPNRKYVLPALGRGRDAFVRLEAMRNGRPVPLENLSRAELGVFGKQTALAATDARFTWKGKSRQAEFVLDRPEAGRPTLVRLSASGAGYVFATVAAVEHTAERVRDHSMFYADAHGPTFAVVPVAVTHLRVEPMKSTAWVVTALPRDLLPTTDSVMRGKGAMAFHHRGDAVSVVLQVRGGGGRVDFYADCDCRGDICEDDSMHRGFASGGRSFFSTVTKEYRENGFLPDKPGVIVVDLEGTWSLDVVDTEPGS
ncbi:hypothetical protein ABIA35_009944 [Catenulispora sp. MAP12-49]|uniref:hypothetical protein n=1 Tax=Catenulispora sp. MAP12-49 TaxID=3156302 RepID=UPI003511578F